MSIEQLEARLVELRKQFDQTAAQLNAISGAIQECEHWKALLTEPV